MHVIHPLKATTGNSLTYFGKCSPSDNCHVLYFQLSRLPPLRLRPSGSTNRHPHEVLGITKPLSHEVCGPRCRNDQHQTSVLWRNAPSTVCSVNFFDTPLTVCRYDFKEVITVLVGGEETSFTLHKTIIGDHSAFFRAAMNGD